ncbi:MAG: CopG family transcriptional regulator [Candidatus Binataceae bacterium]|nr:CopG family transcriptional regulator [Candidatus Binataceae bacterium]
MSSLNVRIAPATAAYVDRLARETGRTKSEIVRQAIENLREQAARSTAVPPAAAMASLIGCWDSGGMGLSERTGERFAQLLQETRHAHRAGRRRTARRAD